MQLAPHRAQSGERCAGGPLRRRRSVLRAAGSLALVAKSRVRVPSHAVHAHIGKLVMLGTSTTMLTTVTVVAWSLTTCTHASASVAEDASAGATSYSNAWADVRGVNYVPSYSRNDIQTWEDYDPERSSVVGYAQAVGFNAVRVFLNMFAGR